MKILRNVIVGLSASLLVACGTSASAVTRPEPSPQSARPPIAQFDPCTLITAGEASAATGKSMANIVSTGGPSIPGACIYRGSNSVAFVYAQVYANAATAGAVKAAQFESALTAMFGSGTTSNKDVTGIGDRAIEITAKGDSGSGVAYLVYLSNVVFIIGVEPTSDSGVVARLAETAVGRLH